LAGLIGKGGLGFEGGGLSEGGAVGGNGRVGSDGLGNTLVFGYTLFVLLSPEPGSRMVVACTFNLILGSSDVVEVRGATLSFAREDPIATFAISFAIASMSASEYPGIGSSVFAFSFPFPFTVTGGLTVPSVI